MKIKRFVYLSAALLTTQLALAKMPFSNEMFGKVEATLDYCAHIDSASAARYQQKKKDMVKDVPEEEVAAARKTDEYKKSYDELSAELAKMAKEDVSSGCAAALQSNK